jgi:hypothetical protein
MLSPASGSAAPGTPRPHPLLPNASLLRCVRCIYSAGMVSSAPEVQGCGKNRTLTSEGRPVDMKVSKAMQGMLRSPFDCLLTLILVAPFTDFSNELAISAPGNAGRLATGYGQDRESCPLSCRFEQFVSRIRQLVGWVNPRSRIAVGEAVYVAVPSFRGVGSLSLSPWSWTISRNDAERSYYDHRAPLELNTGAMITDCGTWHPLHGA